MTEKKAATLAVALLIVFNAIDTFFTVKYIKFGPLSEANPIMDWLLSYNSTAFVIYKIIAVTLGGLLLLDNSENKIAKGFIFSFLILYSFVMLAWGFVLFQF